MKNKKALIISMITIFALTCITIGVSLTFFNYTGTGTTDNTVETGSITFLYTETSSIGRGISITDAFPTSNEEGKALTGEGNVFDFNISSTKTFNKNINYEVTARKNNNSTLDEDLVVMYLTKVDGINEEEVLLDKYNNLTQTDKTTSYTEKVLYTGVVDTTDTTYDQDFRLRMWIIDDGTYTEDDMGNSFTVTVNVYSNASVVEAPASVKLVDAILNNNTLITSAPTLTTSSNNTSDLCGLYKSTLTNSGTPTYYFRGNVENNYVSFAGMTWRVVRINEDGTVRLILQDGINNNATYKFNSAYNDYKYMYYTNSDTIKPTVDSWYTNNLASYSDKIATGAYFCEQAKVKYSSSYTSGNATMAVYSSYTPDFKCSTDGNGYGLVNSNIGLITSDEMVYAGGYYGKENSAYYLYNTKLIWTMSPAGVITGRAFVWDLIDTGLIGNNYVGNSLAIRPVINLKADIAVTGTGTSTDPYVVVDAPVTPETNPAKYTIVNDANSNGTADIGDEIALGDEHFYVISNDGTNINALSKYNLNVGDYALESTIGIQNANAIGSTSRNVTVPFSSSSYNNYSGSIVEGYVNNYVTYLNTNNTGLNATGRLILKEEIESLVNDGASLKYGSIKDKADAKGYSWIYSTSYWSGSAYYTNDVWDVYSDGHFDFNKYNYDNLVGVRPVITIEA